MYNLLILFVIIIVIILLITYVIISCKDTFTLNSYKLYDCFMISSGEEDILLLRLKLLYPYVTKFIIIDSEKSHRGHKKKLINMNNIPNYIKHKIIYENCIFPDYLNADEIELGNSKKSWQRESYQRNRIMYHLNKIANDDDICYISDGDEIPNYYKLLKKIDYEQINWIELPTFVYNINWIQIDYRPPAAMCSKFKNFKNKNITYERYKNKLLKKKIIETKNDVVMHLNRFGNPANLFKKENYIVESNSGPKSTPSFEQNASRTQIINNSNINIFEIKKYFNRVCNGIWEGKIIENNKIKFPKEVYDVLHPIHTMNIKELKKLFIKVSNMSDDELLKFTFNYFKSK